MKFSGDKIRAASGSLEYEIDLGEIYKLESRQNEVQGIGIYQARELMKAMQDGQKKCGEVLAFLGLEQDRAKAQLELRKSVVYLDVMPAQLKTREMISARSPSGSEDQRLAILNSDTNYREVQDYSYQLKCMFKLVEGKLDSFKSSYYTAQRAYDERQFGMDTSSVMPTRSYPASDGGAGAGSARDMIPQGISNAPIHVPTPQPTKGSIIIGKGKY